MTTTISQSRQRSLPAPVTTARPSSVDPDIIMDGEFTTEEYGLTHVVNCALGHLFDLVGHKPDRASAALQQARLQSAWILESIGSGLYGIDRAGKIVFQSRVGAAWLGWNADELIGRSAHALIHHTKADGTAYHEDACPIKATMRDGLRRHVDDELFWRKDGTSFPVCYVCTPMRGEDGEIVGVVVVFCDVSKRKARERANVESTRLLEALFNNTDSAIIDADFSDLFRYVQDAKQSGVSNFSEYVLADEQRLRQISILRRFNAMNRAARRLWALADGEMFPSEGNDEYNRQCGLMALDVAEAMFLGKPTLRQETVLVAMNGERVPIIQSLPIPATEEEAKRVPCVMVDLRQIRMAESARQATIAKSQFLASMSHEIRTPLNGVIGNLELLSLTSPNGEQRELIEQAEKAATSLLALVGNILDFSKIEQGKLTIEMGDVNPSELIGEALAVLQSRAQKKGLLIGAIFDQDLPELVRCDAVRLRQIILNLVGNSLKFTETGGVTVKVSVTDWDGDLCEMKFAVHDSGRGFEQARAAALFDPFVQDRMAVDTSEGTGLGLSICRSLVEALGGTIDCEGVPDEGATFWFTLPMQVVKHTSHARAVDLTGHKVAVLGGTNSGGVLFVRYFATRGATIIRAANLASALAALQPACSEEVHVNSIVMIPASAATPDMVQGFKSNNIIPIMYGSDNSPLAYRQALKAGFAAVFSTAEGPSLLDRNILAFLGRDVGSQADDATTIEIDEIHAAAKTKRVLVLEDRVVNQLVIQKQLAKLGVPYVMANDGLEGLAALRDGDFDAVLCDCSMPNMDGYEFTRAVRGREKADDAATHLPIIALTANAFREDVERCHQAGMDDFISKPVSLGRLIAVLNKWLGPAAGSDEHAALSNREPAIDLDVLQEVLGPNEPDLLSDILREFAKSSRQSLGILQAALLSGRLNGVKVAAHGAKGEARSAGAVYLGQLYAEVERQAKGGDIRGTQDATLPLETELDRVEAFIADYLKAPNRPTPRAEAERLVHTQTV